MSGWLRTYLRAFGEQPPQTLAVSIRRSGLDSQPRPNTLVQIFSDQNKVFKLMPVFIVRESEAELVLIYQLPRNLRIETVNQIGSGYYIVLTEASVGWVVDGVMATSARPGQVRAKWAEYRLRESVSQTQSAIEQESAQVRIVAAA